MVLKQDLRTLAKRGLAALDESHDYHAYTARVWFLLHDIVEEGRKFTFRNPATRTKLNQKALLGRTQLYIANYLTSATFQRFVSIFEDFFFDLLRLWLAAYPASLSRKQLDLGTVLNLPDKDAIILSVVDRELNEVKYGRVADWFAHLDKLVKLGCPTVEEIERLAEIKASRDILAHNKGIANATYIAKAGSRARYKDGELLEVPEPYHRESWETIRKVIADMSEAAIQKA
jgi:hypothetical protein